MNDHDIVLAIQEVLDGTVWTSETPERIAEILRFGGYEVRDPEEVDGTWARSGPK